MSRGRKTSNWVADFETITYLEDDKVRIWAWAVCNIEDPDIVITGTTMQEFFKWLSQGRMHVYFHNLKFDGTFILDALFRADYYPTSERNPEPGEFFCLISNMGVHYSYTICFKNGRKVELRDSLKKLPMPVASIADAFGLEESKGDIDYNARRDRGYQPTAAEWDYIRRDVQIVAYALAQEFAAGMTKLTVGADSLAQYKSMMDTKTFTRLFPVLAQTMDDDIRKAYRGGFTYADPRFSKRMVGSGRVYDVNSLYPSVMYDRLLPYGEPTHFDGPPSPTQDRPLWIAGITFTARLKKDHIPCIQLKNSSRFSQAEYVSSIDEPTTFYVTNVDWDLWNQQYDIDVYSYEGGWAFTAGVGMFCEFIDEWMEVKKTATGGLKTIAKLHLNSLYGKFATNPVVTSKVPYFDDDEDRVKFTLGPEEIKNPVYTAMGVFITAYARDVTIRAAQAHFPVFAYCDTDSLHLMVEDHPTDLDIDKNKLGAWKHEYRFTEAFFIRPKAYIERVHLEDRSDGKEYHVAFAGLPDAVRDVLTFDDLDNGRVFGGKLQHTIVPGGVLLKETTYTLNI